jgi:plastocyanin
MPLARTAAAIVVTLALGACSGGGRTSAVTIKLFQFSPDPVRISSGGKVTWTNTDDTAHRIASGVFDSGDFTKGQVFSFVFQTPGTYPYTCKIHETMRGRIQVL